MGKKTLALGLWIILLVVFVIAASPSTPTILSPNNHSVYYNPANLTVGGSIDPDLDSFNYLIRITSNDTIALYEPYADGFSWYFKREGR